jgi:hypothetical protein
MRWLTLAAAILVTAYILDGIRVTDLEDKGNNRWE